MVTGSRPYAIDLGEMSLVFGQSVHSGCGGGKIDRGQTRCLEDPIGGRLPREILSAASRPSAQLSRRVRFGDRSHGLEEAVLVVGVDHDSSITDGVSSPPDRSPDTW